MREFTCSACGNETLIGSFEIREHRGSLKITCDRCARRLRENYALEKAVSLLLCGSSPLQDRDLQGLARRGFPGLLEATLDALVLRALQLLVLDGLSESDAYDSLSDAFPEATAMDCKAALERARAIGRKNPSARTLKDLRRAMS